MYLLQSRNYYYNAALRLIFFLAYQEIERNVDTFNSNAIVQDILGSKGNLRALLFHFLEVQQHCSYARPTLVP